MHKKRKSGIDKLDGYVQRYPNEFVRTRLNHIWCKLCLKPVSYDRKSQIYMHRRSEQHNNQLQEITHPTQNIVLSTSNFPDHLVRTFLKTDRACHKLDDPAWQILFRSFRLP